MNNNPTPQRPDQSGRRGRRSRRPGLVRRAALAAVCLAGAGGLMLTATGTAFAVVSQYSPQWEELGPLAYTNDQAKQVTEVLTIQNVAESGTELLEDNGNNMNAGGTVDVWSQWAQQSAQDPMGTGPYGPITQANQLWEFVPYGGDANGTLITQTAGELINRQSGLCLDIANNNTADGATIDQWTCNNGQNQQWTAIPTADGNYSLVPILDYYNDIFQGITPSLGIGTGSSCTTNGDGDSVYARTTGTAGNLCDEWNIQQASYDFATYAMQGLDLSEPQFDNRTYQCVPGDHIRISNPVPYGNLWFHFDDLSEGTSASVPSATDPSPLPTFLPADWINYGEDPTGADPGVVTRLGHTKTLSSDSEGGPTGQVMLYCDPATTTP